MIDPSAQTIRARVLRAIVLNRSAELPFPGYFLGIEWGTIANGRSRMAIADGPHCRDANGNMNIAALGMLADFTLGTTARSKVAPGARLATMHLRIQFTGAPATGRVSAEGRLLGFSKGTALGQSLSSATLYANREIIGHASGEFALLDAPPGMKLAPLPWQHAAYRRIAQLDEQELKPDERAILNACDAALAKVTPHASFIQHFWGGVPKRTAHGAANRVAIGPHFGNRVGHVQGGISLGMAAASACAAAPATMMLSGISAWYIGPGRGEALDVRSRVVHAGRNLAVVRTEIKTSGGKRVLETVTHHVARQTRGRSHPASGNPAHCSQARGH